MESGQGGSGHRQCPSCDKYACDDFSGKVCEECWVWFEEHVDFYNNGDWRINGRFLCPYESNRTQECPGYLLCPHCKLNIFLKVTGYENPNICSCRLCGKETFLKGCMCSRCLRQQRTDGESEPSRGQMENYEEIVPPYVSDQMSPSTSSKIVVRDSSELMEDDDDDDCIFEKEIIKAKSLPQAELPPLKCSFTGISKEFQQKARDQVRNGCYVFLYRDMDHALFKKKLGPVENDASLPTPMAIEAAPELSPITETVPLEECIRVERNYLDKIAELKRIIATLDPSTADSIVEDIAVW